MSGTSTPEQRIHVVDAFACTLYRRIEQHPTQNDIADIIRELHACLRRLSIESSDLTSLLRDPRSPYAGQLLSVIDDCDGTLRHLQYTLDNQGRALSVIRSQLWSRISSINSLIDAVQLQRHRGMQTTPRPSHGRGRGGRRDSKESVPLSSSRNDYSYYPSSTNVKSKTAPPPIPPKIPLDKAYNQPGGPSSSEPSSYSYILTTSISTNDTVAKDVQDHRFVRSPSRPQSHRRGNSLPTGRMDTPYMYNSGSSTHLFELPGSSSFGSQAGSFSSSPSYRGLSIGSGLAPDSHGQPIPLDAEWTKIDRDLVSPGVLEIAGVRYEARPTYVAVLGRLSKEQVSAFARQTANYRAGRPIHPEDWQPSAIANRKEKSGKTQRRSSNSSNSSKNESISSHSTADPRRKRASTTSDVPPKSVLKKRSMNRVRFDPNPEEIKPKPIPIQDDKDKIHPNRSQSYDERDGYTYQLSGGAPPRRPRSGSRASSVNDRPRSYSYDVDRDYYSPSSGYDDFDNRSYRSDGRRSRLSISGTANRLLSALSSKSSSNQSRRDRDLAYS